MLRRLLSLLVVCPALAACGDSTSSSSDPLLDASTEGGEGGAAPLDAGTDAPPARLPSDLGKLKCGTTTCDAPAQFCCYSSVAPGGAPDDCETSRAACQAPAIACDESGDCSPGDLCCTGVAVLPRDAGVSGFEATSCVAQNAPGSCKPQPGVGNSSVQACKLDIECLNGQPCLAQYCHGRVLMTCGPDAQCR